MKNNKTFYLQVQQSDKQEGEGDTQERKTEQKSTVYIDDLILKNQSKDAGVKQVGLNGLRLHRSPLRER